MEPQNTRNTQKEFFSAQEALQLTCRCLALSINHKISPMNFRVFRAFRGKKMNTNLSSSSFP